MTASEARALAPGDPVVTYNGKFMQLGTVQRVEAHLRGGYWIIYTWTRPNGRTGQSAKRHQSVYLPYYNP